MEEPIEEVYFNWLCARVKTEKSSNHMQLLRILHNTEFVWVLPMDQNRAEDGLELRREFLSLLEIDASHEWLAQPCSVLEFLVAFSRRAWFQTDISEKDWFWEFIQNLGLYDFHRIDEQDLPVIENILHTFIWRLYDYDGYGGLFPMRNPKRDQRKVEIWYQFFEYLEYRGLP